MHASMEEPVSGHANTCPPLHFPDVDVHGHRRFVKCESDLTGDDVAECTHPLRHGDTFHLLDGEISVRAIQTPCHTPAHICYHVTTPAGDADSSAPERPAGIAAAMTTGASAPVKAFSTFIPSPHGALFSGDTLFVAGCGR